MIGVDDSTQVPKGREVWREGGAGCTGEVRIYRSRPSRKGPTIMKKTCLFFVFVLHRFCIKSDSGVGSKIDQERGRGRSPTRVAEKVNKSDEKRPPDIEKVLISHVFYR